MSEPDTISINDVNYVRADSVTHINLPEGNFAPWVIGKSYHIETVTKYFTGILLMVTEQELLIGEASWVCETGRFNEYISGSNPNENEPFTRDTPVIIGRGSLIDAVERKIVIEVL